MSLDYSLEMLVLRMLEALRNDHCAGAFIREHLGESPIPERPLIDGWMKWFCPFVSIRLAFHLPPSADCLMILK